MEEPKLYQLVYMSENVGATDFESIAERLGDVANLCVDVIQRDYGLSEKVARALFEHVSLNGNFLRRVDPGQIQKEKCTYCNQRRGFDYIVEKKC